MQNNSNKNWENEGWEAMQQMLEKDLPTDEKQPKRKFVFWFWAAGFALMIGAGWMFFLTSIGTSDSVAESPKTATTAPSNFENNSIVKNIESDVDNSLVMTEKATEIEKNNDLSTLIDESENEIEKINYDVQLTDNQVFVRKEIRRSSPEIAEKIENVVEISNNVENVSKYVDNNRRKEIDSIVASNIHFDLKTSGYSKYEIELAEILPFRGSELEVYFPQNLDVPEPIFAKVKKIERATKKAKPSIRLVAGTTISFDPKINGFETGALINLPIKNSKWSFETGLNYRFSKQEILRLRWPLQRSNKDTGESAVSDSSMFSEPSGDDSNEFYYQSEEQLGAFSSQKYHLLSVPLNLRYGFHSKWSIAFGLNSSFVLNSFFDDLSAALPAFSQNLVDSAFSESIQFQKYDLAATATVKFQMTDRWNFNLNYNHGNLLNGNGWQVNNQYFKVGTGFTF